MPPEDRVRILHIIEAIEAAQQFIRDRDRAALDSNKLLLFALIRAIEIVGEAAGRISERTRDATGQIPWALIVSMRNRLIHAYFDIDHDTLWKTATEELPKLLPELRRLLTGS
jgi:uncharacterized protein with HEPN domain